MIIETEFVFIARVVQQISNLSVCTDADLLAKSGQGSCKERQRH